MLVVAIDEGQSIGLKLEDGREIKIYVKIRRSATRTKPGRVGVAIDAPSSVSIDRNKSVKNEEKEN